MADNSKLLQDFFEAENRRDWSAFGGYLHPDVMRFIHAEDAHTPVAGREDYLEYTQNGYKDSDVKFACARMDVSASGNRIAALIVSEDGQRSLAVFDFEDGLIRWEHNFLLD